jgi:hypothetical protein
MAVASVEHVVERGADEVQRAEEVDASHLLGPLGLELRERRGVRDAGVGDHGVEPPRLADEALDGGVQRAGVADVGGHLDRPGQLRGQLGEVLLVARHEPHLRAAPGQGPRRCAPDATGGAGQDHPGFWADLHRRRSIRAPREGARAAR